MKRDRTQRVIGMTEAHQMANYARFPVAFVRGEGVRLFDAAGKEYLDLLGGIAVAVIGHANPAVSRAIGRQARALVHVSNLFHVPVQSEAARLLAKAAGGGKVFFCNSGTEANEAAIKLGRKWAATAGRNAREIVVVDGSFHGRTYGGLSATAQPKYHEGFEPMLPGFRTVPFGDLEALDRALTDAVCMFLVEPIQGESGVRVHPDGYLREARRLCLERGILFAADEIQTALGRTGAFLACATYGVEPDIVTFAKGLANGLPLGAVVARKDVAAVFGPGSHGSTFGGNPVCCAAARVVLGAVTSPDFLADVRRKGDLFREGLARIAARRKDVREVRGLGLMLAIEMECQTKEIAVRCLERGLIVGASAGNVLRFLPPLTVVDEEIARGLAVLEACLPEGGA